MIQQLTDGVVSILREVAARERGARDRIAPADPAASRTSPEQAWTVNRSFCGPPWAFMVALRWPADAAHAASCIEGLRQGCTLVGLRALIRLTIAFLHL